MFKFKYKTIILVILILFGKQVMANDKYLNYEKLNEYRKDSTIAGHYLNIWGIVMRYLEESKSIIDINHYLISFTENDNDYIIYFKKPSKKNILGGGNGECKVDKRSLKDIRCKFIK